MGTLYDNHTDRIDTVVGERRFWSALAKMKFAEFGLDPLDLPKFVNHVLDTCGVEIYIAIGEMNLSTSFTVVDEQKFLLFLLKYSS